MPPKKRIRYRDLKTGRLAPAWKARRYPKRFVDDRKFFRAKQAKRVAEGPPAEISERTKNRAAEMVFEYALGSTLLQNFDFGEPSIARVRGHRGFYLVVLDSGEYRFAFLVNNKTGEVKVDQRPPSKKGK